MKKLIIVGRHCFSAVKSVAAWLENIFIECLIIPIKAYRKLISPFLPRTCRFTPTCSRYMIDALRKRGPIVGLVLGFWRVFRCNPLCRGGYDPVRPRKGKRK